MSHGCGSFGVSFAAPPATSIPSTPARSTGPRPARAPATCWPCRATARAWSCCPATCAPSSGAATGKEPRSRTGGCRGPHAKAKWITAGISGDAASVVASVLAEADRRDPPRSRTWIAVMDGNNHQIALVKAAAAERGIPITIICDFIHVTEYLWQAAWCFRPEASPDAAPWVRGHAAAILEGRAPAVAAAIRAQAAALPPAKARAAATAAAYLENKAPYLDYPAALASGWPISSGVSSKTARTSPAPAGASTPPKPSSNSAPSTPTATSTPTGNTTSKKNKNATTHPP